MNRNSSTNNFESIVRRYEEYINELNITVAQLSVEDLKEFKENYLTRAKKLTGLVQIVSYLITLRNQKVPSAPKAVQPKQAKAAMGVTSTLKRSGVVRAGDINSQTDVNTDNTHTPVAFSVVRRPIESDDEAENLVSQFKSMSPKVVSPTDQFKAMPPKMVSPTNQVKVQISDASDASEVEEN